MTDIQELREMVNPVFSTARSCVQLHAAAGDEDAQRLLDAMGFESFGEHLKDRPASPELAEQVRRLTPAYMVLTEARFKTMNELIESRDARQVVDLPCGYTPRGVMMHRLGRAYFGLDLPAVIDAIAPATRAVIGVEDADIRYRAVDATNYDSLEAAVADAAGELLVVTEGLLMYFMQQELEEVFSNIRRLLSRHGGSWVIADRAFSLHDQHIASAALGHDPALVAFYKAVTARAASSAADVTLGKNVMFDPDEDKAVSFVRDMGFELREVCCYDYLPREFGALRGVPERDEDVREAFRDVFFWELTVASAVDAREHHGQTFSAKAKVAGRVLDIALTGRLDTLTAPDLLDLYRGCEQGSYDRIVLDFADLDYISSAGIRVLMMMVKATGEGGVRVAHARPNVREAIDMTGLGEFLTVWEEG